MQVRAALASALDDDDMAASSAAERRPQLSLPPPVVPTAKFDLSEGSTGNQGQFLDQAAAEASRQAEHALEVKQEEQGGSTAIQLASAGNAEPMDVSESAEDLKVTVQVGDPPHCLY